MQIQISRKGQEDVIFTCFSAEVCGVEGEFFFIKNSENLMVGNYSLLEFDFEVKND